MTDYHIIDFQEHKFIPAKLYGNLLFTSYERKEYYNLSCIHKCGRLIYGKINLDKKLRDIGTNHDREKCRFVSFGSFSGWIFAYAKINKLPEFKTDGNVLSTDEIRIEYKYEYRIKTSDGSRWKFSNRSNKTNYKLYDGSWGREIIIDSQIRFINFDSNTQSIVIENDDIELFVIKHDNDIICKFAKLAAEIEISKEINKDNTDDVIINVRTFGPDDNRIKFNEFNGFKDDDQKKL